MAKKNQKPTPEYDSQRETRVLLEQIRDEVKVVAEQHGSIKEDLTMIKSEVNTMKTAILENSLQIKGLKAGQDELRAGQDELRAGQDELRAGQDKLRTGQERIEKKLDNGLANHEQRIRKLEEKVGT